jgi:2-C-methyl-D-erythritol 4-phosphate cytidylyltransferase
MYTAILLAAGKGLRLKSSTIPKQFLVVNRKPLYRYSLETFIAHKQISQIVLVVEEKYVAKVESEIRSLQKKKPIHVVVGGTTRQASSFEALKYIQKKQPETSFVLIHDVARPLISVELIDQLIETVKKHYAVTLGLPIHSSVISSNQGDLIDNYIPRQKLFLAQTPQAFHFPTIYEAHQTAMHQKISSATDDASLIKIMNKEVKIINGSRLNFKITHEDDLALLKAILLP